MHGFPQTLCQQPSFYVDWESASCRILGRDGTPSELKGDLAIKLHTLVQAKNQTGYLC